MVDFRRIGFEPVTLRFDVAPDSALRIVMRRLAHTVDAVRVVAQRIQSLELRGFYERVTDVKRGINNGFFITPEEIESRPGARVTDFLSGRAGIRVKLVQEVGKGRWGLEPQGLDGCRMTIYVDGVRFHMLNSPGLERGNINFINDLLSTNTVAGIEVYPRSVTAPPKYQSLNGTCGVILIWTR